MGDAGFGGESEEVWMWGSAGALVLGFFRWVGLGRAFGECDGWRWMGEGFWRADWEGMGWDGLACLVWAVLFGCPVGFGLMGFVGGAVLVVRSE